MSEQATSTTKQDGHLVVYLAWPLLAGLGLAGVLGVSVGGIVLLASRFDWKLAGAMSGYAFFIVLGLATLGVFWYATTTWGGPLAIERVRQEVIELEPEPVEPETRFISVRRRPALQAPANPYARQVAAAVDVMANRLKRQPILGDIGALTITMEPQARPWVVEFYDVLMRTWQAGAITRRTFEELWPQGGQALYYKYIQGKVGERGIFQTWNIIAQTGPRGSWEYCQPLDVIVGLDPELFAYASAKAEIVTDKAALLRIGLTDQTGQGSAKPNQTEPNQP